MMSRSGRERVSWANKGSFFKFCIVGGIGVVVNEALLLAIDSTGVYLLYAGAVAIEVSILSNFVLNDLWTFRDRRSGSALGRLVKFNALMLVGLAVNLAVLDVGTFYLGLAAAIANLAGIVVAFVLRYVLSAKYAWMKYDGEGAGALAPSASVPVSALLLL